MALWSEYGINLVPCCVHVILVYSYNIGLLILIGLLYSYFVYIHNGVLFK